jgi:hypothetical protein
MGEFELISVAEDDYRSDQIKAKWTTYNTRTRETQTLDISVSADRKLRLSNEAATLFFMNFDNEAIDSLIQYLQDAKTFLSEEDMVATLIGKRKHVRW